MRTRPVVNAIERWLATQLQSNTTFRLLAKSTTYDGRMVISWNAVS